MGSLRRLTGVSHVMFPFLSPQEKIRLDWLQDSAWGVSCLVKNYGARPEAVELCRSLSPEALEEVVDDIDKVLDLLLEHCPEGREVAFHTRVVDLLELKQHHGSHGVDPWTWTQ